MGVKVLPEGFLVVVGHHADDGILFAPEFDPFADRLFRCFKAYFFDGRFIEKDGQRVGFTGVKISSFQQFHPESIEEIVVDADDPVLVTGSRVAAYETYATGVPVDLAARNFRREGYFLHSGDTERLRLEAIQFCRIGGVEYARPFHYQCLADLYAQVLVLHEVQLPVNGKGAYHQDDGGDKLDDDEGLAEEGAVTCF